MFAQLSVLVVHTSAPSWTKYKVRLSLTLFLIPHRTHTDSTIANVFAVLSYDVFAGQIVGNIGRDRTVHSSGIVCRISDTIRSRALV